MKAIGIIVSLVLSTAVVVAETNKPPSDLVVVKITTTPFMIKYDGDNKVLYRHETDGFELSDANTNEFIFKRGEKTIRVTKGKPVSYSGYEVEILDKTTGYPYIFRTGHDVRIGAQRFTIYRVNLENGSCSLLDVDSGKIRKLWKQKAHPEVAR